MLRACEGRGRTGLSGCNPGLGSALADTTLPHLQSGERSKPSAVLSSQGVCGVLFLVPAPLPVSFLLLYPRTFTAQSPGSHLSMPPRTVCLSTSGETFVAAHSAAPLAAFHPPLHLSVAFYDAITPITPHPHCL